jgi:hypothetical protein
MFVGACRFFPLAAAPPSHWLAPKRLSRAFVMVDIIIKKNEWCEHFAVGASTARDKMSEVIIRADQIMSFAAN